MLMCKKSFVMVCMAAWLCTACIGTVIGTAVDVTTEVIKVPFKVVGAVVDVATDDGEQEQ